MAKDAKKNNKDVKNKRHFFKDFKAELKKVIWPTPKQLVNKTVAVIVIVLITAAIVFVLDLVFEVLNDKGVNRLKANVRKTEVVQENTVDSEENAEENTAEEAVDFTDAQNESQEENAEV